MPFSLHLQEEINIISVVYEKETDFGERLMALEQVVDYIQKNKKKYNLLIDVRKIITLLSTTQEYAFGVKLANCHELKGAQVAVLKKPENDENKFINTVAINRGYILKVFFSADDAMNWLQPSLKIFKKFSSDPNFLD